MSNGSTEQSYETVNKLADEYMKKAMAQDWTTNAPWVAEAAQRMNEMSSAECLVHVMRLTKLASASPSAPDTSPAPGLMKSSGKEALQKFNLALAKCAPFMEAMRKIHEAKDAHREDAAWFKSLQIAADAVPMPWEKDPDYFLKPEFDQ